ncbi:HAD hydrolase-like protein [Kitasatospora viridis]|uniref:Beta-phosphoglucomutase-like phosphatase (HAD superfamily) n=1 Tax=Kitasatospora viridis TaxID=281105 RepID=A0A561TSY7_9ACTN|nr:HAD hydrolase-like protein [Kitasatospora viridis]TWF90221.1 beta-phosphoglucomutase-like phosphatase (HAD superfamily) [Kitasatospora viridis]
MMSSAAADGRQLVLIFDMDGTLLDTETVKLAAFRDAFAPLCAGNHRSLAAVHEYNAAHRGVPRDAKFRHVLAMLGAPEGELAAVAGRYADLLADRLPSCQPLPGVAGFLKAVPAVRFVASSAPRAEIVDNLTRHGLDAAFTDFYGHPWSKEQALLDVARRHPTAARVFFGDAPADLAAARATRTRFMAINPNPQPEPLTPDQARDFQDVGALAEFLRDG